MPYPLKYIYIFLNYYYWNVVIYKAHFLKLMRSPIKENYRKVYILQRKSCLWIVVRAWCATIFSIVGQHLNCTFQQRTYARHTRFVTPHILCLTVIGAVHTEITIQFHTHTLQTHVGVAQYGNQTNLWRGFIQLITLMKHDKRTSLVWWNLLCLYKDLQSKLKHGSIQLSRIVKMI